MQKFVALYLLAAFVGSSVAQFKNGRILEPPVPDRCAQRIIHERAPDGKGYYFSWKDPAYQGKEKDWLAVRNFCRQMCMDSVSLETSPENEWIKQKIVEAKVSSTFCNSSHVQVHEMRIPNRCKKVSFVYKKKIVQTMNKFNVT
uniref:Putative secreted protein n=1 Tax=Lutzomyia longipalpis TaxID=7200 RepID=A0A1B0F071_LUTLO